MKQIAVLFSGQDSHYVGMGRLLYETHESTKQLFAQASAILGMDMAQLCFGSQSGALRVSATLQPAVLLCSVAAYYKFKETLPVPPMFFAGHGLGELSALVCAEAITFADGLMLARQRGLAMADNSALATKGMMMVTQIDLLTLQKVLKFVPGFQTQFVLASLNAPKQVVLSGERSCLEVAAKALRAIGAHIIPLKVNVPLHSPVMAAAAEDFNAALAKISMHTCKIPVVMNATTEAHTDAADIAAALRQQMLSPLCWTKILHYLNVQGVEVYIEAGPRDVLKQLNLTNLPGSRAFALDIPNDVAALGMELAEQLKIINDWPGLISKCMAIAVCTPNKNWNEAEYQLGVTEPYRELKQLQQQLESEKRSPTVEHKRRALQLLDLIFATKCTSDEERHLRFQQIAIGDGDMDLLQPYLKMTPMSRV